MPNSTLLNPLVPLIFMQMLLYITGIRGAAAIDETVPHPIDERGLLSQIAVNTTRLFRTVEVVEIRDANLTRPELEIVSGTVVVLENQDKENHRLLFPPGPRNQVATDVSSPVIKPGERWGAQFLDPGTYPYHCTLHPDRESGVVEVVEALE